MIRTITEEDIAEIASVHAASWKTAFRGILSDHLLDGFGGRELEECWEEILKRENRINLLFEDQGKVAGFIAFQQCTKETTEGEIIGIYVDPEHWRKGIGSELMREATVRMGRAGFKEVFLWTMTENLISNGFYLKEGFERTSEAKTSSRNGEFFEETKFRMKIRENQSVQTTRASTCVCPLR